MVAMDDSSPPSATFYDTNERNRGLRQKVHVLDVVLNSRALLQEMDIWHMTNASRGEHPKQAGRRCSYPTVQSAQDFPVCGK